MNTITIHLMVGLPMGVHARTAVELYQLASHCRGRVTIVYGNRQCQLNQLAIGIDRIRHDFIQVENLGKSCGVHYGIKEHMLAVQISREFEALYQIVYTEEELDILTILLVSHLLRLDYKLIDLAHLEALVGGECICLVDEVLKTTEEYYLLNVTEWDFYVRFAMHIHNLLIRAKTRYINKNPIIDTIKTTCPLLFDCAVTMSNIIERDTGFRVSEDEIAYIALHVGSLIDIHEYSSSKLKCVILFPQYYDLSNKIMSKLEQRFAHELEIKDIITSPERLMEIAGIDVDVVLSTIPVHCEGEKVVVISSFLTERDYLKIEGQIEICRKKHKKEILMEQLLAISNPSFFYKNKLFASKEEAIHAMMEKMIEAGYADGTYEHGILERERLSPTAFDCIAVPHSMKMDAFKTGMFYWKRG